jgi:hypothetical protein
MSDRERRRAKRRHKAGKDYRTVDLGNGIETASADAVLRAMGSLPPDLDWASMAPNVIPILPRRRPMPFDTGEPFRVTLPPGIPTGFGVDIGPALLMVATSLLETWPVEAADIVATGLENVRRRLRSVRPRDIHADVFSGIPVRILQSGVGCASALVLVPDELVRIFGPERQCLIAPMRDVLISLPAETDRGLVGWLNEEFATMDPNGLALDAFVLQDGALRYEALVGGSARG